MGRCIDCRCEFNRAKATDKLRCPACTKPEPQKPGPKSLKDQLKALPPKGRR